MTDETNDPGAQEIKRPHDPEQTGGGLRFGVPDRTNDKAWQRRKQVWEDERVDNPSTTVLLLVLATLLENDDECSVPQAELAKYARMSRATLNIHMETIEQLGYIRRERGYGRSPTVYIAAGSWIL